MGHQSKKQSLSHPNGIKIVPVEDLAKAFCIWFGLGDQRQTTGKVTFSHSYGHTNPPQKADEAFEAQTKAGNKT